MRLVLGLTILAASAGVAFAAAPASPVSAPPKAAAPAKPAPLYLVVQGSHTLSSDAGQKLTVFCPGGRRATGAGYSALFQAGPKTPGGPPQAAEGGLDQVRSFPDMQGTGWQVSGVSPDSTRLKLPWQLVVRVICVQIPG